MKGNLVTFSLPLDESESNLRDLVCCFLFGKLEQYTQADELVFNIQFRLPSGTSAATILEMTNYTETIENFDKGYPVKGDIVACWAKTDEKGIVTKNFGQHMVITGLGNDGVDDHDFYLGTCNTTQQDFYEPFTGTTYLAFNSDQINKLYRTFKANPMANEILGVLGEKYGNVSRSYNVAPSVSRSTVNAFGKK